MIGKIVHLFERKTCICTVLPTGEITGPDEEHLMQRWECPSCGFSCHFPLYENVTEEQKIHPVPQTGK